MPNTAAQRVDQLRKELEHHNELYYQQGKPEISDQEYDRLMRELIDLETQHPELQSPDSPSQRVGGKPIEGFVTVEHAVPMMSIDNTYDEEAVRAFDARVRKSLDGADVQYVLEPKIDGVSANVRYENGRLVLVATRGDGRRGDDITNNAKTIGSIPLRLHGDADVPQVLEVRGEIHMANADFQKLNEKQLAAGEDVFKNPRNLTTGALKALDPKVTAERKLRFVCHGLGQVEPLPVDSYWKWLTLLKKWHLPVAEQSSLAKNVDEVIRGIEAFQNVRGTLAYQTDGMVVKVDSFAQRDALGVTSKSPRWVIAFKYAAEQMQTVLKGVDWQVGKGGTLTPVARMNEVFLSGSNIGNATLHNIDQIRRLDIHYGDTVVIEKAGEVIPYVCQAVPEKRPTDAEPVEAPSKCPSCGAPVEKEIDGPRIRCINPDCPAQFRERLEWFCARSQMDIENIGEALVGQLIDARLVTTFADLYRLKKEQLRELEGVKEKLAAGLVAAIAGSKKQPLDRFLAGLGMPHVGNRVAFVLASRFGSLDALEAAKPEQLSAVNEIGEIIAQAVYDFFHSAAGKRAVGALKEVGLNPTVEVSTTDGSKPLEGKTVVVTGSLQHFKRDEIEGLITRLGGRASGSVSKKTSFLVAGEEAGSKLAKARELGVEVIDEQEFRKRIGQGGS